VIRVLFLTLYPETMPSSRLRVYQYLPYLRRLGIEATVSPVLPEPWFSRFFYNSSKWSRLCQHTAEAFANLGRIYQSRRFDLVFIQKGILPSNLRGFDLLLERMNPRLIFDLDDAVYGRNIVEFSSPLFRCLQDRDQTKKISSLATAVVAGNCYLRDLALQYNRNVFLIPTPVDTNRFCPRPEDSQNGRKEVVIGWIGVNPGLAYVQLLEKVFQELARKYQVRIKIITRAGKEPLTFDGVNVEVKNWTYESEVSEIQEFDIGVMPLPDDEWTRGKCGLKLLQYMALGIPGVASRVGANLEIVEDGMDGFLAQEPAEWIEKLSRLIESRELRQKMGEAARQKAVANYSLEKMAPQLAEVLKRATLK
jgi:glycosyltransferase involved in cell wall biosynthesis